MTRPSFTNSDWIGSLSARNAASSAPARQASPAARARSRAARLSSGMSGRSSDSTFRYALKNSTSMLVCSPAWP
jgi:hypothetical protein